MLKAARPTTHAIAANVAAIQWLAKSKRFQPVTRVQKMRDSYSG